MYVRCGGDVVGDGEEKERSEKISALLDTKGGCSLAPKASIEQISISRDVMIEPEKLEK